MPTKKLQFPALLAHHSVPTIHICVGDTQAGNSRGMYLTQTANPGTSFCGGWHTHTNTHTWALCLHKQERNYVETHFFFVILPNDHPPLCCH